MRRETQQSSRGARGGKARLGCNQPRKRGGNPAGFGQRGCRCLWYLDAAGDATEQQGSPRGQGPPRSNQPRKRGGTPAGFGLRGCRCLRYVRCGGRRNRAAGEPEGARPASGAISRGNAEATPQAWASGGVAVCGMLDAAGSPAAQMKCYIIRSARSGYRKNRPASYRTCGAVLCNVRFRLRAALTSSAT